jgi:hypothetical protein
MWERSVREYVKGFSDAIIPESSTPREKAEAILAWMRVGPPRREARDPSALSSHDPTDTLNYRQLLAVCGSATNAFLNLGRSAGLETRRLLLLNPDRTAKHVVAEVKLDGRWVVVDATYRVMMKDARGDLLTRKDLQDPKVFQEAMRQIPGYIPEYSYERYAEFPGWEESFDWSILLERRSFAYFFLSVCCMVFLLLLRIVLAWLADHRLRIPRFRLRTNLSRATATLFSTPEIK